MCPGATCIFYSRITSNLAIEMQGESTCTQEHEMSVLVCRSFGSAPQNKKYFSFRCVYDE